MSYHLFLDDERQPLNVTWVVLPRVPWTVVRNYDQFVKCIEEKGVPSFVTFDHDLAEEHYAAMLKDVEQNKHTVFVDDDMGGLHMTFDYGSEKTGYDCAKWLCTYCQDNNIPFPDYDVHSMNPVGTDRIFAYIENFKKHVDID